jgi:hypothetical protein
MYAPGGSAYFGKLQDFVPAETTTSPTLVGNASTQNQSPVGDIPSGPGSGIAQSTTAPTQQEFDFVNGDLGELSAWSTNGSPSQLTAGQTFEADQLSALGIDKNRTVLRPTLDQVNSPTFQAIVGDAQYTGEGEFKGTIFDGTQNGNLEIKGGTSALQSTYQLRLQTYFSVTNDQPYTIMTTRPVSADFQKWLDFGV